MPRKVTPLSLSRLCINTVVDNWDEICYFVRTTQEMSKLLETDRFQDFEGPFVHMPSTLLVEFLEVVKNRHLLTRKYLHPLVREQLEALDLSLGRVEVHYGFRFLTRCKRLSKLNLAYQHHIEPIRIMRLLTNFPLLTVLNLRMTFTTDEVLELISYYCPNIRDLNLTDTLVTDFGIRRLCGVDQDMERAQNLQRLVLVDTKVTSRGALTAVRNFPKLTQLVFHQIFQVFQQLDPSSLGDTGRLSLRMLESTCTCILADSISSAALLCPEMNEIIIRDAWIDNETLYRFMQFENLTAFTVANCEVLTLDFDEGILPVLQVIGQTLQVLQLENFVAMDILSVGRSCPHLGQLSMKNIGSFQNHEDCSTELDGMFKNLTSLELLCDQRTEFFSAHALFQVLHSAKKISNLHIRKCDAFCMENLQKIWITNDMADLRWLTVEECQAFEPIVVHLLLSMENPLENISVWSCPLFTRQAKEIVEEMLREQNLDLHFGWYAC